MPVPSHPYLDHPAPLAFAHRGGAREAPENSMAAFESAVRLGYRYLETDAQATRDGVLVAFHDATLDRVTDRTGRIADMTWDEVRRARIAGREPIPRLDEVIAAWPETRINIDPKTDAAAALLPDLLRRTGAVARVCIGAFSDARLARLRRAVGPELCLSMGPRAVARLRLASLGVPCGAFDAACVQVPPIWNRVPLIGRRFVAAAHRFGLQIHVWTIDDPGVMHRLLDLGIDGIMTDRPSVLKRVLIERHQWIE